MVCLFGQIVCLASEKSEAGLVPVAGGPKKSDPHHLKLYHPSLHGVVGCIDMSSSLAMVTGTFARRASAASTHEQSVQPRSGRALATR